MEESVKQVCREIYIPILFHHDMHIMLLLFAMYLFV